MNRGSNTCSGGSMFFLGLGTAVPEARYSQVECWEALCASPRFPALGVPAVARLQRVLCCDSGVRTLHRALPSLEQAFEIDPDVLHRRFIEHAPVLALRAATAALERSGVAPREIDALLISTC